MNIDRPYEADRLVFRYRATTLLLEVMAADALPHLLCQGWWAALLRDGLYGAHPGVEFLDDAGRVLGEADVVLLLHDGGLAVGECKRRANGLARADIDRLEHLGDLLDVDWTFYATPEWAKDCSSLWRDLQRDLPERRRIMLSGEQLLMLTPQVFHALGTDPGCVAPLDEAEIAARRVEFREFLPRVLGDLRRPNVDDEWVLKASRDSDTRHEPNGTTSYLPRVCPELEVLIE